jgi:hypothetical protein
VPREAVRKTNPIIPRPIIHAVWASFMALKASSQWPAVLARAAPMTPAQGADEGGARAPPQGGNPRPLRRGGGQSLTSTTDLLGISNHSATSSLCISAISLVGFCLRSAASASAVLRVRQ